MSTSDPTVRADVQHLLELWEMLPSLSDTSWWGDLAEAVDCGGERSRYFMEKVRTVPSMLHDYLRREGGSRSDYDLQYLAQYVLMFFDRDDRALFELLDRTALYQAHPGRVGRRWAADATAVAWRLYVPGRARIRRSERNELGERHQWQPEGRGEEGDERR